MMNMRAEKGGVLKEHGFTLVEVMVSIVVAMTILAGLMLSFVNQSNQYKYQNKRIDTSQDLEFALKFIEEDLRGALIIGDATTVVITDNGGADPYTQTLEFKVWDSTQAALVPADTPPFTVEAGAEIVTRTYGYDAGQKSLRYDRESSTLTLNANSEILPHVTFFKVFDDYTAASAAQRSDIYTGMPSALPQINIPKPDGSSFTTSGYTILIEVTVDAGYKGTSPVDVRGNIVTNKRIWRYVQVYPMAAVAAP